jgi:hypothetical protein
MKLSQDSIERIVSAFAGLELGDPRRAARVESIVSKLAAHPQAPMPQAMGTEADIEGAYRLMNNGRVTGGALNDAHARTTAQRARAVGRVFAIHDTTSFEFQHADPAAVGYLNTGKPGFMAHYALVVAADGSRRPLGVANVEVIARSKPPARRKTKGWRARKKSGAETVRKKDRESTRWYRGFAHAQEQLQGSQVVHVADREGDSYELMAQAIARGQRLVIRARVLARRVETDDGSVQSLEHAVEMGRTMLVREVELSTRKASNAPRQAAAHPGREARKARLDVSGTRVTIHRPRYQDPTLPDSIEVNVVRVFESQPPTGAEAVEWVLYTTEPVTTDAELADVVDAYCTRWLIEECNKALKTGCRYEEHQFESRDALTTLLALSLPIACELLWLRAACRANPKRPASDVLTRQQLQILAAMAPRGLPRRPTVHDALWAVASLGGHLRSNGEPGWLVLHRGMTTLRAYEEGWRAGQRALEKHAGLPISR